MILCPTEGGMVHVMDGNPNGHAAAVGDVLVLSAGAMCPELGCLGGLLGVGATPTMGEHLDVVIGI